MRSSTTPISHRLLTSAMPMAMACFPQRLVTGDEWVSWYYVEIAACLLNFGRENVVVSMHRYAGTYLRVVTRGVSQEIKLRVLPLLKLDNDDLVRRLSHPWHAISCINTQEENFTGKRMQQACPPKTHVRCCPDQASFGGRQLRWR